MIEKAETDTKAILAFLDEKKTFAQRLIGIISDTGMAHGYQKTANEERKQASFWKGVAFWSLAIWIAVGVVFFFLTYDKDLTWATVARQTLISTPFILLAGFGAMQVKQSQVNERRLRQAELELASIDPFLATLSDQERNEVKRDFATRYFGRLESEGSSASGSGDKDTDYLKIISELTTAIAELRKAIKP
ncbi:hypothetical protein [Silvimonas soli]|uniref:hypothetical protein n=1 Tax=Silvimonas soli TaxID=2980100 RepID=UPI0024B32113|nr:hypothetical protein [Silvimonas soli]